MRGNYISTKAGGHFRTLPRKLLIIAGHFMIQSPQVTDSMGGHFFGGHFNYPLSVFHANGSAKLLILSLADTFVTVRFHCPKQGGRTHPPSLEGVRPDCPPRRRRKAVPLASRQGRRRGLGHE